MHSPDFLYPNILNSKCVTVVTCNQIN